MPTSTTRLFYEHTSRQAGFALGYLLLFVALFALISASVIQANQRNSRMPAIHAAADKIVQQGEYIRGHLATCAILYPLGDNGTGFHLAYPGGSGVATSTIECPGNPSANKNLWTGIDGNFLPANITGFGSWIYTNDATGVKLTLTSTGEADYNIAASMAAAKYVATEAGQAGNVFTLWVIKG